MRFTKLYSNAFRETTPLSNHKLLYQNQNILNII